MPISFPTNPIDGQQFTNENILYTYFSNKTYWKASKILWNATRYNEIITATSLAVNTAHYSTIEFGANQYLLASITTDKPSWITVYSSLNDMTADTRNIVTDPSPTGGVVAEVIATSPTTTLITPLIYGNNTDSPITSNVYCRIVNTGTSTETIQVQLTIINVGT